MKERRRPIHEITPRYEDAGIFKAGLIQITVSLVPMFNRNSRQDIIIKGFVDGDRAIDVVFAGRRKTDVKPLMMRLQTLMNQARSNVASKNTPLNIDNIRHPIRVHGSWRPRFTCDDQGWQSCEHQLYAARWLMMDKDGTSTTYGEMPTK